MPARDKGKSKSKGTQSTLASFYKLGGNGNSAAAGAADADEPITALLEPMSPRHSRAGSISELEDVDNDDDAPVPAAKSRASTPYGADIVSHIVEKKKKTRPVSDIPVPVLTARQRAKVTKHQKSAGPTVGPLDRLIASKSTAVPPAAEPAPSSSIEVTTPPQRVINIDLSTPLHDNTDPNPVQPSTPPSSSQGALSRKRSIQASIINICDDTPERPQAATSTKILKPAHRTKSNPRVADGHASTPLSSGRDAASPIDLTSATQTPVRRRRPDPNGTQAPQWPGELADHVNVPPRPPRSANSSFSARVRARSPELPNVLEDSWLSSMTSDEAGQAPGRPDPLHSPSPSTPISLEMLSHKALATVDAKYRASLPTDHELWTMKYRPMNAREVLGNENRAQYMKEWLMALELLFEPPPPTQQSSTSESHLKGSTKGGNTGIKRPRVVRVVEKPAVKKRRKVSNGYDSDWVVSDEDEEELEANGADDDDDTFLSSLAQVSSRSSSPMKRFSVPPPNFSMSIPQDDSEPPRYDFSARLTNSLLIVGPPGCGKTAAVYACAKELGWGVLEVYPGMGKRGGSQVMSLVEGVGKNHTLMTHGGGIGKVKAQLRGPEGSVLDKLFSASRLKPESKPNDSDNAFRRSTKSPTPAAFDTTLKSEGHSQSKKVNQSIILLEEVDILFQGESGFWQAVIDVIKESRRPVIMTCNDVKLVPIDELPLQDVLYFESCPIPGAVSYLQRISQVEGHEFSPSVLESLYTMPLHLTNRMDYPDQPYHPVPSQQPYLPDLRHALLQLQMMCTTSQLDVTTLQSSPCEKMETLAIWTNSVVHDISPVTPLRPEPSDVDAVKILRSLATLMENVSFADCIDQRVHDEIEAQLNDQYETLDDTEVDVPIKVRPDDMVGHHIIRKPLYRETACALPHYSSEDEIAIEVIASSRRLFSPQLPTDQPEDSFPDTVFSRARLYADRAAYQAKALLFLEQLLAMSGPLLPRSAIFLDYVPWITTMVRTDDVEEQSERERLRNLRTAAQNEGAQGLAKLRMTRNSLKHLLGAENRQWGGKFTRYLDLDQETVDIVHETALSWKEK